MKLMLSLDPPADLQPARITAEIALSAQHSSVTITPSDSFLKRLIRMLEEENVGARGIYLAEAVQEMRMNRDELNRKKRDNAVRALEVLNEAATPKP